MKKLLISLAAATATVAVAAPASAQWGYSQNPYGQAYGYGNAQGYGYGYGSPQPYGYGNQAYYGNYGGPAQFHREIQQIRYQADQLNRQGRLTRSEARDLYNDLASAERAVSRMGRGGVTQREIYSMNDKMARIRYELRVYSDYDRNNRRDRYYDYRR